MTMHDAILIGIIVAAFSALAGIAVGKLGKISREECESKRGSCTALICSELKHIKEEQVTVRNEQKELKVDIKEILKYVKIS